MKVELSPPAARRWASVMMVELLRAKAGGWEPDLSSTPSLETHVVSSDGVLTLSTRFPGRPSHVDVHVSFEPGNWRYA